ncbi:hypothetical protein QA649_02415 [Bradyrhizobium sp. CB1717]|uniref:hypothetical protein n=1 Tax=Bradyrhizobium sp. CB1717 TaxID=3039154 RepID=UPI0024B1B54C|nr:hypothetical protein [Bradyrhizobium sp. CB1717]WFU25123.1 hypothetical protein QA649_02415 [Bradyrhizobium sp. CB1717]
MSATNLLKRKDEAELWVTGQLVATRKRISALNEPTASVDGIIGIQVFDEEPPRVPAQRVDFIYWTAMRRWGFYRSRIAQERARLFNRWRGSAIGRVGDDIGETADDVIREERLAEFLVPEAPSGWQSEDGEGLDFELKGAEAVWLRDRLLSIEDVAEGPCLLAKAAELCVESPPQLEPSSIRLWDDVLIRQSAKSAMQLDRLERARQASYLSHYVRAIYAALVEWVVETTASPRRDLPLRYYRELLGDLAEDRAMRDVALALSLHSLFADVPRIPGALQKCLHHVQVGLRKVAGGEKAEAVFMNNVTHRLFELVERRRKGGRARLSRTEQGAARRIGFDRNTINVYDLDYRWGQVRSLLADLHRGLTRA